MRIAAFLAFLAFLLAAVAQVPSAWAHASLLRGEPADGAVVTQPPSVLKLTFNEPVSPLVMRLVTPAGETITPPEMTTEHNTVVITPPPLQQGTYVLSWRVISADGHPVGGALMFSVGAPSAAAPGAEGLDTGMPVKLAIWAAKLVLYLGLFVGIGGVVFIALIARHRPLPARAEAWIGGALIGGLLAATLSVGLQGLDALALPLPALGRAEIWASGLATSYGATALIAGCTLALGLAALRTPRRTLLIILALGALGGAGLALAVSGHAGTQEPQWFTRSAVFLHGVAVAFWIGALLPLFVLARAGNGMRELTRFSRAAPIGVVVLVVTGFCLAVVQLDRVDALWTTTYGMVLSGKLILVLLLLGFAAANRYVLMPRLPARSRALVASLGAEFMIVLAILGVVALWRFTPPPRALAATEPVSIHIHGERAMAQLEFAPIRARGADVSAVVLDGQLRPLPTKEITLVLSNPAAGIEPIRRPASVDRNGIWHVRELRLPVTGRWRIRLEILVSDFDRTAIEDDADLPRAP